MPEGPGPKCPDGKLGPEQRAGVRGRTQVDARKAAAADHLLPVEAGHCRAAQAWSSVLAGCAGLSQAAQALPANLLQEQRCAAGRPGQAVWAARAAPARDERQRCAAGAEGIQPLTRPRRESVAVVAAEQVKDALYDLAGLVAACLPQGDVGHI